MKRTIFSLSIPASLFFALVAPLAGCSDARDDGRPSDGRAALDAPIVERPANVPADYVVTPNGYFHPSCLFEVREGEHVEQGKIVSADGAVRTAADCAAPRFDRTGREIRKLGEGGMHVDALPTIGHSWLADFNQVVSGVTWQAATFKVPLAPLHQGSNIVFFFNAIQPSSGLEIIQPVLQWNQTGYANQWTIASWYVDHNGRGYHTTPVPVAAGDTLQGYMYPQGGGHWFIGMNRNGAYATGFSIISTFTFNWVFGGVMEVYNVGSCEDLPSSGYEFFTNEATYQNGAPITPSWTNQMFTGFTPNCNVSPFSGTTTGGITWLYE